MYRKLTPYQIAKQWQDDIEQCMEAGTAPVMELGASHMPADELVALLAIQRWSALRTDLTTPSLPAGGVGPHWLAAMLPPLPRLDQTSPPQPITVYAGANEAEYLMTAEQLYASTGPSAAGGSVYAPRMAVPVSYFVPMSQPGMSLSWDALPFQQLYSPPLDALTPPDEEGATDAASGERLPEDSLRDWLAWAGLLLALFLVLLAILL